MGLSGSVIVLGQLPLPGLPKIWIIVGQGPTALTVGAGGDCLDIFFSVYHFHLLSPFLWETAFSLSFPSSFSLSLGDGLLI